MDARYSSDRRILMRGRARYMPLVIITAVVLLAAGAWLLIVPPHQEILQEDRVGSLPAPAAASTVVAASPTNLAAMGVSELLAEARKAMSAQRYLAPAGNNAFEFYLRVLEKQPDNRIAADALRETFPFAANSAEQAINARDFSQAQRQIDLLARADPTNFTVTILRSKLEAQRQMLDQQQQQAIEQQKEQLAATQAAAEKQAADQLAALQARQSSAPQTVTPPRAAPPTPTPIVAPVASADSARSALGAGGPTSDAVLTQATPPAYPAVALRTRQSGWVLVAFTIDTDGRTSHVDVVGSQPRGVFDRAATDAVRRYRFAPAMSNGVAVSSRRQQKIEFNQ